MRKRILMVGMVASLIAALFLGYASAAQASPWTDLPDSLLDEHGITSDQVSQISMGFGNGLWRPEQQITRAQFVKMTCLAFGIAQADPAVSRFADVKSGSTYYTYIEGAVAAGIVNGVTASRFVPDSYVTREQGLAMIARAVALATNQDLSTLYTTSQMTAWLAGFTNGTAVSPSLRSAVTFAANLSIARGTDGDLDPRGWLTRIDAAMFLARAGAPTVASISPGRGAAVGGDTVVITGTGLIDVTAVRFGEADATSYAIVSDTQLTAVVPEGTVGQTVNVVVTNPQGSSDVWETTYTYTHSVPVVTSVSPDSGSPAGGNTAIISGTGFVDATAVQFGGVDADSFTVVSDTRITAVVPAGTAGATVCVTVVGPQGVSVTDTEACAYSYTVAVITSINPAHGTPAGGNTVTITGTGFASLTDSDTIEFGDVDAWSYTVVSDTELTVVVPMVTREEDDVDEEIPVEVTLNGQDSAVQYTYDPTEITAASPDSEEWTQGSWVIITGTGFTDATAVYFGDAGDIPAASFTVVSDTRIKARVPTDSGDVDASITVVTFDGYEVSWD
jgi:hypothetical protein